nr:DUF2793 domain-containing protein [Pararhodobacter sp. SW119]
MQQGQAQKHLTHNEALELLDVLVQLTVEAFDAEDPPPDPAEGEVWALGAAPSAAWAGQGGQLAAWANGGWFFILPKAGWRAAKGDEVRIWTGDAWAHPRLADLPGLGINVAPDAENRLSVSSGAVLFSHEGGDHRVKVNKAAAGDTASLLFQAGFSGRAELGLAGSDDFALKVSADGADWTTAIGVSAATGIADLQAGATIGGKKALHLGNLLGTVTQSGGAPTGAVIERGANANGEYVRFADGTQICTRVIAVDVATASTQTFAFPAAFVGTRQVAVTYGQRTGNPNIALRSSNLRALGQGASGWAVVLDVPGTSTNPGSIEETLVASAIGRWF